MEYTAQHLEYAVSVFYNGEQADRAKAHAWLTAAQRVPEAWNFVWELLQPTKGTEVQFYGATTLHTKILRCWSEVPPESHDELKEKILQAVFAYSKGPKIVTNRLCISLAAFILQQGTTDLATILRPLASAESTSLLLEVLTVIPEEYNSMTMGSALRAKNRAALQQACPAVLDDMLRYLQTVYNDYSKEPPSDEIIQSWQNAATCACSWLTLGGEDSLERGPGSLADRMPLCRALLTVVHLLYSINECVSDVALDACEACLAAVRAAGGSHDAARFPHTALELIAELASLAAPVIQRDNVPNSINEELLSALITCCVALSECHSQAMVKACEGAGGLGAGAAGARQMIELLLAAQGAPGHYPLHENRSNLVFGFWYSLQDDVLFVMEDTKKVSFFWREVFSRLLDALVCKSEAPDDAAMSRDDVELLRCYRQDIADTVMYCFGILGDWCWSRVEAALTSSETEARREAALHVFVSLADAAPRQRAPAGLLALLQQAVQAAHTARSTQTLHTALDCLGSYASWLSSIPGARGAELGGECVQAAGAALQRCPAPAALALRKLCSDCTAPATAVASDIVQIAQTHLEQSEPGKCDVWVARQLAGAAGAVLAACEPSVAAALLRGPAAALHRLLQAQALEPQRSNGSGECAAVLIEALGAQPALADELFRLLLPTLAALAQHPPLVEPLFQILKHTVLTLSNECNAVIGDIAQLTITSFNTQPCPTGLDVVKLITMIHGREWADAGRLLHACVGAAARAVLREPSAAPELAEALFALLHTLTKKRPQCMDWLEDLLPDLVELACECVRMWEARAARAACGWLAVLALQRPAALQPRAPALTAAALRCIGGATPRNHIEPLAELLLALNRAPWALGGDLGGWLRAALAGDGFPTHHATPASKTAFIANVVKEKCSKRRLLETVQEFSLVCRGLIGTEYARQTLASKQLVT
ncbi:importin-13 isoform X3 [Ostrinia furnacalis]|uniref:importin-13 isoform X3 n=1 Tax=Ostrinia furnacalis TaxID=93504 RepID=UPI00103B0CD3|nr:importin-13 isoform X3 [Ostrinia furnacalis]